MTAQTCDHARCRKAASLTLATHTVNGVPTCRKHAHAAQDNAARLGQPAPAVTPLQPER